MKTKPTDMETNGFVYKDTLTAEDDSVYDVYRAVFPLPDDGAPGSTQELVIDVKVPDTPEEDVEADLFIRLPAAAPDPKNKPLGRFCISKTSSALADLLYGAARKKTYIGFEPIRKPRRKEK